MLRWISGKILITLQSSLVVSSNHVVFLFNCSIVFLYAYANSTIIFYLNKNKNKKHNFAEPKSDIILCTHVTLQPTASQKQGVLQTGSAQVGTLKACSCAFPNGPIYSMCGFVQLADQGSKVHFHASISRLILACTHTYLRKGKYILRLASYFPVAIKYSCFWHEVTPNAFSPMHDP